MACEENQDCVPCSQTCPEGTVCPDIDYHDVQCATTYPFKCSIWTGEAVDCLNIESGDSGDVVISKLMSAICDQVLNTPDNLFRISATDTTSGYFQSKILAGTGILLTKSNASANEQITIALDTSVTTVPLVINSSNNTINAVLSGTQNHTANLTVKLSATANNILSVQGDGLYATSDHKVKITTNDTTPNFLLSKISAGTNISVALLNSGGNESIQISCTSGGILSVATTDTSTVDFSGNGTSGNPLQAAVILSGAADNGIVLSSGLYFDKKQFIYNQIASAQASSNAWISGRMIVGNPLGGDTGENLIVQSKLKIVGVSNTNLSIYGVGSDTFGAGSYILLSGGASNAGFQVSAGGHLDVFTYSGSYAKNTRFLSAGGVEVGGNVSANAFFETSDKRLKEELLNNPIFKEIGGIQSKLYRKAGRMELGYYAQDVVDILPSAVTTNELGYLSLSYTQIFVAKIALLEQEIAELKKKLSE